MEDVSEMEEIELGGLPEDMPEEIGEQISLEEEKSKEAEDDDEDDGRGFLSADARGEG